MQVILRAGPSGQSREKAGIRPLLHRFPRTVTLLSFNPLQWVSEPKPGEFSKE